MLPLMEFMKSLGKGSYGSVDLIRFTKLDGSNPYYHAVNSSYAQDFDSLHKEFQILSKLRDCPRIVRTFGTSLSRGVDDYGIRVYKLSMVYAAAESLFSFMERTLSESMIRDFTIMILEGLVSVHNLGYVHCDLKPENILVFPHYEYEKDDLGGVILKLKSSYELKISDFDMSTKLERFHSLFLGTQGVSTNVFRKESEGERKCFGAVEASVSAESC
ncbi:unnamed protein product [Thlaspi arvense]|uniref:Protein kinase domain-containing protein n=1 Tax=Thlaspi arvense TaxID=13288 RepID=A0AAU9T4T3_THLAR|nr:unnamed protein product [Thlaspi arvense]